MNIGYSSICLQTKLKDVISKVVATTLMITMLNTALLCSAPLRPCSAQPASTPVPSIGMSAMAVYLYENGIPVYVATDSVQGPHVYNANDHLVGTIDAYGNIWSPDDQLIGFVEAAS